MEHDYCKVIFNGTLVFYRRRASVTKDIPMKKKGKTLAPRNPFALAARQRRAGAHDKTYKIKRRDNRQALKKLLLNEKEVAE
jgi:hypothetical protein